MKIRLFVCLLIVLRLKTVSQTMAFSTLFTCLNALWNCKPLPGEIRGEREYFPWGSWGGFPVVPFYSCDIRLAFIVDLEHNLFSTSVPLLQSNKTNLFCNGMQILEVTSENWYSESG